MRNDNPSLPVLILFLENSGRLEGVPLPRWAMQPVDWAAEEYAKLAVWLQARHHYSQIVVLEDEQATAAALWQALLDAGSATVDVLMLVHGQVGYACGHAGQQVGADFFEGLRKARAAGLAPFRLRAVYQMNCYGETLADQWLSLGAQAVNGSVGVNWLPEPSLSVFLHNWLGGRPFDESVQRGYRLASRVLGQVWRPQRARPHPKIASSQMVVFGDANLTIEGRDRPEVARKETGW